MAQLRRPTRQRAASAATGPLHRRSRPQSSAAGRKAVDEIDESRAYCKLRETDKFVLADCLTAKVELEEPIHQILNLPEYNERAVSVHIYSKPFHTCLAYCRDTHTFKEVSLSYTSIGGKLCTSLAA